MLMWPQTSRTVHVVVVYTLSFHVFRPCKYDVAFLRNDVCCMKIVHGKIMDNGHRGSLVLRTNYFQLSMDTYELCLLANNDCWCCVERPKTRNRDLTNRFVRNLLPTSTVMLYISSMLVTWFGINNHLIIERRRRSIRQLKLTFVSILSCNGTWL